MNALEQHLPVALRRAIATRAVWIGAGVLQALPPVLRQVLPASGYVIIFGGWSNSLSAIARRDEHGGDRRTTQSLKVEAGKRYHFVITRRDGAIRWELDGQEALTYDDPDPLTGPAHRHFAFGGWEARVAFDNLEVFAL